MPTSTSRGNRRIVESMDKSPRKPRRNPLKTPLGGLLASILFVAVLLGVMVYFGIHEQLLELLRWVEEQGAWAALLFVMLMTLMVVLLLPGILMTTGAGFVFGVAEGTLYVVIGTTLGAAIAFLVARYLFGERARRYILEHGKLRVMNDEMAQNDFKVVLLTRLIPFFPSKLSNYFFGLTSFSFRSFVLASLIGFTPFSLHNVYLGSLAADLASLSEGELVRTPLQWAFYGLGFAATVVAVIYFNRLAQRALGSFHEEQAAGRAAAGEKAS